MFEYRVLSGSDEAQQLGRILAQCFNSPANEIEPYFDQIGLENFRILRQDQQIVGGLAMLQMGQWWGGARVSMTGIASVGIAPEFRGSGAAIALMQHAVQEMHAGGVATSVLYAAAQRLYRKAGYEQAGNACGWEVVTGEIQVKERSLPVHSVPIDSPVFRDLYPQQARSIDGFLDRNSARWQGILKPEKQETVYAYCFGEIEQPQGYVIFQQSDQGNILIVRDWVLLTAAARLTFWTFLNDHRSTIEKVRWKAGAIDDLTLLLPEQPVKNRYIDRWLLRVVNVTKALEQRGYPPSLQTEMHLDVRDDLILENNDRFVLSIDRGKGRVTRGGRGDMKLDIRGLAPLYTGLFGSHQLQLAGLLETTGADNSASVFEGRSPWMMDFF